VSFYYQKSEEQLKREMEEALKLKKKFMKIGGASLLGILFLSWLLCFSLIKPGYVGVVVDLFGSSKGVESKELNVGMHWIAPWKKVYTFPIFEQNITWEGDHLFAFQTKEGMSVNAEIGITYHLDPSYVPVIFQKYRKGMHEISHIFIRNYIRDALNVQASKVQIEDLYSSGKEIFFKEVQAQVQKDLKPLGIEINRIYLINRFIFPQGVIAALNSKIEATQRAQQRENELREAEAEAKKIVAQAQGRAEAAILKAQAQAKANQVMSESLTGALITWEAIQKWNGVLPQVMGKDANMLMQLEKTK